MTIDEIFSKVYVHQMAYCFDCGFLEDFRPGTASLYICSSCEVNFLVEPDEVTSCPLCKKRGSRFIPATVLCTKCLRQDITREDAFECPWCYGIVMADDESSVLYHFIANHPNLLEGEYE